MSQIAQSLGAEYMAQCVWEAPKLILLKMSWPIDLFHHQHFCKQLQNVSVANHRLEEKVSNE